MHPNYDSNCEPNVASKVGGFTGVTIKAHGVGLWAPLVGPFEMLVVDFGPKVMHLKA